MKRTSKLKIAVIGAGSVSFAPATINDILLNERITSVPLEICLMDIREDSLKYSREYAEGVASILGRTARVTSTAKLEEALEGADFAIVAIEVDRYFYWSQDFHIPRRYGFRQIYGENGGPGGMFHTLRNLKPMLHIAKTMEKICPDAWLINYTNPEAKLVEAVLKLTKINSVGLCHGIADGLGQISRILGIAVGDLDTVACGLNHFGWFQSIKNKNTGVDLYPEFREKESRMHWLDGWDEFALSRIMFRTYGLWPYPGANHIGEYIGWAEEFLASSRMQYFFDPAKENPWITHKIPDFVYNLHSSWEQSLFKTEDTEQTVMRQNFTASPETIKASREYGIPIIEAIAFGVKTKIDSLNVANRGKIPGLPDDMVVELPAYADGDGIHPINMERLPEAVTEMIRIQGSIHKLVIEAFAEQSRNKLLQAVLLDPTASGYHNAAAMIDEMCELQKDILPVLN